jgi:hypothetical protein
MPSPVLALTNVVPSSPSNGDRYIAGSAPGSPWTPNHFQTYLSGVWDGRAPIEGESAYDRAADSFQFWNGSAWIQLLREETPDFGSVAAGSKTSVVVAAAGVRSGYVIAASADAPAGIVITATAESNQIVLHATNCTASPVAVGVQTIRVKILP